MTVVDPTDRPKSVSYRSVIDVLCRLCVTLSFTAMPDVIDAFVIRLHQISLTFLFV